MTPEFHHLSEEELNDLLIGLGSHTSATHLAGCTECRAHVDHFTSGVRLFNQASLAWSEARNQTRPEARREARPGVWSEARCETRLEARRARIAQSTPTAFGFHKTRALVGSLAAAILTLAVAIPVWRHQHDDRSRTAQTEVSPIPDSQAEIAQDNQLMQAVNAAINPPQESPLEEYGLSESTTHDHAQPK